MARWKKELDGLEVRLARKIGDLRTDMDAAVSKATSKAALAAATAEMVDRRTCEHRYEDLEHGAILSCTCVKCGEVHPDYVRHAYVPFVGAVEPFFMRKPVAKKPRR